MFLNKKFILASQSKSRFTLLKNNDINIIQKKPICNEEVITKLKQKEGLTAPQISLVLAKNKALSISKKKQNNLVVGSDTIIEFNKKICEKNEIVL